MVYRVGVGLATRASEARCRPGPRDRFIGWTPQLREKKLPLVIDNPRFLILLWITIPKLGSHILSLVRRQLPDDWTERYNTTPVLIETFVETPRFTGALYKARAGPSSEPPWDGADTTDTPDGINRRRTSGSDPCGRTGGALSTGEIMVLRHPLRPFITPCPNKNMQSRQSALFHSPEFRHCVHESRMVLL